MRGRELDPKHCVIELRRDDAGVWQPFSWASGDLVGWFPGPDGAAIADAILEDVEWCITADYSIHEPTARAAGPEFMGDVLNGINKRVREEIERLLFGEGRRIMDEATGKRPRRG